MLDLIYFQNTKHPGTKENHEATSIHEKPSQASYEIQSSSHFATKPEGGDGRPVDAATLADETILIPSL